MKIRTLVLITLFCVPHALFGQVDNLTEYADILYIESDVVENDTLQRLNLVLPEKENAPLFVWIGGGAWAYVNRHMEMNLVRQFASEGMAVASVGHRLSPAVWRDSSLTEGIQHPRHIEDVATAFKWLYDHADEYGYNRDEIFVGGFSSGGHLAALLSMDEQYLAKVGLTRDVIQGVIPIGGAYDIPNYHQVFREGSRPELAVLHVEAVFGSTEEEMRAASPTSYVESMTVPMLLISENQTYNYTRILEDHVVASGFEDFSVVHVEEMGHGEFWNHLSTADTSAYRDMIVEFIHSEQLF